MRLVNFFSWAFLLLFAAGVFALPSNQYRNVGEEEDETEANGQQQHLNDEEVLELVVKNPFFKHLRSSINGVLRERMDTFHFDDVKKGEQCADCHHSLPPSSSYQIIL